MEHVLQSKLNISKIKKNSDVEKLSKQNFNCQGWDCGSDVRGPNN